MADLDVFELVNPNAFRDLFDWLEVEQRKLLYSFKYEPRSQWGPSLLMSRPSDTVPGQPQPGEDGASEKAQATSSPEDLAVDPRSADS